MASGKEGEIGLLTPGHECVFTAMVTRARPSTHVSYQASVVRCVEDTRLLLVVMVNEA